MSAHDIQNRILTLHQRQIASLVGDIERIEAISYLCNRTKAWAEGGRIIRRFHTPDP